MDRNRPVTIIMLLTDRTYIRELTTLRPQKLASFNTRQRSGSPPGIFESERLVSCILVTFKERQWQGPKSLTTPHIVRYILSIPLCSAVRMSSGNYYTLYSALKVSHNASQKVVCKRWSLNKQYLPSCIALREKWQTNCATAVT